MSNVVYLAAPFDWADPGLGNHKTEAIGLLNQVGWGVYDPTSPWSLPSLTACADQVHDINVQVMRMLGRVLVLLPPNMGSVGAVAEMIDASEFRLKLAVWSKPSLVMSALDIPRYSTVKEAVDAVVR